MIAQLPILILQIALGLPLGLTQSQEDIAGPRA